MKSFTVLFLMQLLFVWLRTLNIAHIASKKFYPSLLSGTALSFLYITTTALGVKSYIDEDWLSFAGYMSGGILGAIIAMKHNQIKSYFFNSHT